MQIFYCITEDLTKIERKIYFIYNYTNDCKNIWIQLKYQLKQMRSQSAHLLPLLDAGLLLHELASVERSTAVSCTEVPRISLNADTELGLSGLCNMTAAVATVLLH
jgi:hypothetical protein